MPRAGVAAGTGAGTAAGTAGPAAGKVPVTVGRPPLTVPLVGMTGSPCGVAASPVTMATSAPADRAPATIFDRRAGDCGGAVSVVGITVGRFGLVVIVVYGVVVASRCLRGG